MGENIVAAMTISSVCSFGSLFSGGNTGGHEDPLAPYAVNMKYEGGGSGGDGEVGPALSAMRSKSSSNRRSTRGTDLFDGDTL